MRAKHLTAKQAASELRGILWLVGSLAFALLFPKVSRAGEYSAEQWAALVRNGELSSRAVQGDLSQEEKWGVLEATLVFPAFAVPGSAFEKEFKEQEAAHRKIDPKFFKDEWWPLMLAADVGKVLNIGPNQEVLNLFKDALANSPGGKQSQAKLAAVRSLVIPAAGAQPTPYASAATDSNVREYRARAAQGDAIAQYSLGACYWNGQGVDRNFVEAAKWFRKAADQGNTLAQSALGYFYYAGEGVEQNYAKAVQWWRRAAE